MKQHKQRLVVTVDPDALASLITLTYQTKRTRSSIVSSLLDGLTLDRLYEIETDNAASRKVSNAEDV